MTDLRNTILDVIRDDEKRIKPLLSARANRTHAFLGSCDRRMTEQPAFSLHGDDHRSPCILCKVYSRLPHIVEPMQRPLDQYVLFQYAKTDCCFLKEPRDNHGGPFPIEWEFDWVIEVENDWLKFTFTLRVLLNWLANHRLGIFFCDDPDGKMPGLTTEFLKAWKPFAAKYNFANDLHLQAVFFPETYTTFPEYSDRSRTYIWNGKTESFRRL